MAAGPATTTAAFTEQLIFHLFGLPSTRALSIYLADANECLSGGSSSAGSVQEPAAYMLPLSL